MTGPGVRPGGFVDEAKFVIRLHEPRRWRVAAGIGFLLLVVMAFGLFEIGRRAGGFSSIEAARERSELSLRITALEEDKAALQAEIARLETTVGVDQEAQRRLREDLESSTSEIAELNEELAFYRRIMAPPDGQQGLRVQAFDVTSGAAPGRFRLRLVLIQARQRDARTSGELDVALKGSRGGEEVSLSLVDLEAGSQSFDFRYFQDIDLEVALPADFQPESAMVVLTPKGRGAVPVSASFPWNPGT